MSDKDKHIKELQNLLAAERAAKAIYEAQIARLRKAFADILDIAEDAL